MPIPQDLQSYLEEIQRYLKLQRNRLQEEYIKEKGKLPPQNDPFSELTQAINCVESLKLIQDRIYKYWNELES